ncbi:MAG: penicillin-binding transpeptidase domain-containing protein [Calditrichota bacterium]
MMHSAHSSDQLKPSSNRLLAVVMGTLLVAAVVFVRLVWVHFAPTEEVKRRVRSQGKVKVVWEAKRGDIYDWTGERPFTNALDDYAAIGIDPSRVGDPRRLAKDLASILGYPAETFLKKLSRDADYVVLAREVSPQQMQWLTRRGWFLHCVPDSKRDYPQGRLASQTLGFTDVDGVGISGVELSFDELLRGEPGWKVYETDVHGKLHDRRGLPSKPPRDGCNIKLTLEASVQSILEEELSKGLAQFHAQSASGIVLEPRTGQIRALASLPSFDPNQARNSRIENQKLRVITERYEPGSIFKIIAFSLLMEKKLVKDSEQADASAQFIRIQGHDIHDVKNCGWVNLHQSLVKSSNVGTISFSRRLKPADMFRQMANFGFFAPTGVELPGEVSGCAPQPETWSPLSQANIAIGQGIAVSLLHMACAYAAVVNDGVYVTPSIIAEIQDSDGDWEKAAKPSTRRVISSRTAQTLTENLIDVVEHGTGKAARIEGIKIAGKTGTAQKPDLQIGGYRQDRYLASFVGVLNASDPSYLILIALDEPVGVNQGGAVAAPIFRRVATRILGLNPELRLNETASNESSKKDPVETPDLVSLPVDDAEKKLSRRDLHISARGRGEKVVEQYPQPGVTVAEGDTITVTLGFDNLRPGRSVIVPLLRQLSLREAVRKATEAGLTVSIGGTGRVSAQYPSPGTRVKFGSKCELTAHG